MSERSDVDRMGHAYLYPSTSTFSTAFARLPAEYHPDGRVLVCDDVPSERWDGYDQNRELCSAVFVLIVGTPIPSLLCQAFKDRKTHIILDKRLKVHMFDALEPGADVHLTKSMRRS
jgi:hypothetical protein